VASIATHPVRVLKQFGMAAPTPQEQRYHWAEGNKYAIEAMKALLWLNGGSAGAMLAFFGARARSITPAFGWSLISFGFGAFLSVVLFVIAYFAQLDYANNPSWTGSTVLAISRTFRIAASGSA
jgi:hypothetical protein